MRGSFNVGQDDLRCGTHAQMAKSIRLSPVILNIWELI